MNNAEKCPTSQGMQLVPVKPNTISREEGLVMYLKNIYSEVSMRNIAGYYAMGAAVNRYYTKEYGANELGKIAEKVGMPRDTLQKACKFNRTYTLDQFFSILNGELKLHWRDIANNLTIPPEKFIEVYQQSSSLKEFHYSVRLLKPKKQTVRQTDESESVEPSFEEGTDPEIKNLKILNWRLENKIEKLKRTAVIRNSRISELKDEIKKLKKDIKGRDELLKITHHRIKFYNRRRYSTGEKRKDLLKHFTAQFPSKKDENPDVTVIINPYKVDSDPIEERLIV